MVYESPNRLDSKAVRITITLNRNVYEEIKRVSETMGLRPSTWMTMICTSKVRNVDVSFETLQPD